MKAVDMAVFGHEVTRDEHLAVAIDRRGVLSKTNVVKARINMAKVAKIKNAPLNEA